MSNKPAHKIRTGNLLVVIWRNIAREKGNAFYSYVPLRCYKDGDETWKEINSFTGEEALIIGELLRQAWTWGTKQEQADYAARKVKEKAANGDE